jgi:hypothetical protein
VNKLIVCVLDNIPNIHISKDSIKQNNIIVIVTMKMDLNIRSQDLNQLAASQLELPRRRSGTG